MMAPVFAMARADSSFTLLQIIIICGSSDPLLETRCGFSPLLVVVLRGIKTPLDPSELSDKSLPRTLEQSWFTHKKSMPSFVGEDVMHSAPPDVFLTRNCSGGPAGCVVAGRLAYADPNLKVMLIEGQIVC